MQIQLGTVLYIFPIALQWETTEILEVVRVALSLDQSLHVYFQYLLVTSLLHT